MDSAPAGATRMGSRSSTRHGGPALVFVGPVRKWRKAWSPVSSSSPSPSAARVVLYKWSPLTPSNGGVKEDSAITEETVASPPARPVKYLPLSAVIQKNKDEIAKEAAEGAGAQAGAGNENVEVKESTTSDMVVDAVKESDSGVNEEEIQDPTPTTGGELS